MDDIVSTSMLKNIRINYFLVQNSVHWKSDVIGKKVEFNFYGKLHNSIIMIFRFRLEIHET